MAKELLHPNDTDFVRDNMLFNYCLGDNDSLLIESFVRNNGIALRFDVRHYYFLMTGTHKRFRSMHTPKTFGDGVTDTLCLYQRFAAILHRFGCTGNVFLVKEDNSKQVGVLFSPLEPAGFDPEPVAHALMKDVEGSSVQKILSPAVVDALRELAPQERLRRCMSTSLVGPFAGYEQIHHAFTQARALNDLNFFGVHGCVITEALRARTARSCDVAAVTANVRKLLTLLCSGTCARAVQQAAFLVEGLVAPSYSMQHFDTLHAFCADIRTMLETVYGVRIEYRDKASIYFLSQFQAMLCDAVRAFFAQMQGRRRYSPMLLQALTYINHSYTADISLAQLAEYVCANPSTLSSELNAELGASLSEYVCALRVRRAQQLLRAGDATMAEVATACGFASAKYFREQFKRLTGVSPQGYRDGQPARDPMAAWNA